jgi:uncharacterized membrane protein
MAETIENYAPQIAADSAAKNKTGQKVWLVLSSLSAAWLAVIISPPLLKQAGFVSLANDVYYPFGFICHQISARSFHIYDDKLAVCARCFGVYAGVLFGFLFYPLFRSVNNIDPLPRVWLILACVPMAVDFGLTFFHIWENTHLSRFITGAIVGSACAIYIMPALVEITFKLKTKENPAS